MGYGGGRAWSFGSDAPRHSAQGLSLGLRRQYNSRRPEMAHRGLDFYDLQIVMISGIGVGYYDSE